MSVHYILVICPTLPFPLCDRAHQRAYLFEYSGAYLPKHEHCQKKVNTENIKQKKSHFLFSLPIKTNKQKSSSKAAHKVSTCKKRPFCYQK